MLTWATFIKIEAVSASAPIAQFSKEVGNVQCVNESLCGESSVVRLEGSFVVEIGWMLLPDAD